MNAAAHIVRLTSFAEVLPALLHDVDDADARWRPPDGGWTVLEIVSHLADEEVEDFRTRVRLTLEGAGQPWPPIDPQGWVEARKYNQGDLGATLGRFLDERTRSLEWLRSLDDPDWSRAYEHPVLGRLRAGDLFAAWTAHDWLHARQIVKRRFELTQRDSGKYDTGYAGSWAL